MPSTDAILGAILGLAIGDAYGRPLEFVRAPKVYTTPVDTSTLTWTDDTHMSLYVARAILSTDARAWDEDRFGTAVAEAFVAWKADPFMPYSAPGNTCLSGVARYERCKDWKASGVRESDGCGAVMRVGPVGLAYADATARRAAARVQAIVTHAHPNALEAAVATAELVWRAATERALTAEMVADAAELVEGLGWGGTVGESLRSALRQASTARGPWLEEESVAPGDGGWRSGSALGLAVVAALRWGAQPVEAVEKAARIAGDSDSVACVTGLLLGAAHGPSVWPAAWVAALKDRAELESVAQKLAAWGASASAGGKKPPPLPFLPGVPPAAIRTSEASPLKVAWAWEGVGPGQGAVGLTFAPGKRGWNINGDIYWYRSLAQDLDRLVQEERVGVLVSLVEEKELALLEIPSLVDVAAARKLPVLRFPIVDTSVPSAPKEALRLAEWAAALARGGQRVVFHCRGGLGRAGTLAALTGRMLGVPADDAIAQVRRVRPGAIETPTQARFVREA